MSRREREEAREVAVQTAVRRLESIPDDPLLEAQRDEARRATGDVRRSAESVFRAVTDHGIEARLTVENARALHPEYQVVVSVDPNSLGVLLHEDILQCVTIADAHGARLSLMQGELAFLWPIDHVPGPVGQDGPAVEVKARAHNGSKRGKSW
jgi:hypothetical protein